MRDKAAVALDKAREEAKVLAREEVSVGADREGLAFVLLAEKRYHTREVFRA